ncbi:MAG: hypothetical protein M1834_009163 [Cirrosporium novae-zelandiae]|nr:MAG: hypothetical protein M1834_009163 [Cirrosporium novae-zelandiae]
MAPPPAFSDIAKLSNDLLNKDFYHASAANLEVKTKAPNGVAFTVKGKSAHDGPIAASTEAKYADKSGKYCSLSQLAFSVSGLPLPFRIYLYNWFTQDRVGLMLVSRPSSGVTITQGWTTANSLDTKVELDNTLAKGLKAEVLAHYLPATSNWGTKMNLYFKQPNFHVRTFIDPNKGPTASIDAVLGHEGFLVGCEAGYDVQKAAITKYSAALGYNVSQYAAAITATNNLSVFSASYYHKVNDDVEAGAKATWDSKTSTSVGLELASKYKLDPTSFVKAKINDRGIAALAYNIKVRSGVTFGAGVGLDTQKLDQPVHKIGASLTLEA